MLTSESPLLPNHTTIAYLGFSCIATRTAVDNSNRSIKDGQDNPLSIEPLSHTMLQSLQPAPVPTPGSLRKRARTGGQ